MRKGEKELLLGKIAERRAITKVSSTVQLLLNVKFQGNSATNWGIFHEEGSVVTDIIA